MKLEAIKGIIRKQAGRNNEMVARAMTAQRYYKKKNDILSYNRNSDSDTENPLRNADNRIPSNFYSLLVNQKSAYLFTAPPLFDLGNESANSRLAEILGDGFAKCCKDLCINASNDGVAWLHLWQGMEGLVYAPVPAVQIRPLWSSDLDKRLIAVLRIYEELDDDGVLYDIYEYWTDTECHAFRKKCDIDIALGLEPYNMFHAFETDTGAAGKVNSVKHGFAGIPFVPFFNNNLKSSDLDSVKELIDVYDKVFSGFINDLEDIQEIIFVLSGYEGENLKEFLSSLKKYKTIKVDGESGSSAGLQTLTIDIPIEAREKMLSLTRKAIFEQGQGVDPDPQNFGNASGVALKYLYSLLELKAGLMETEFKLGFGKMLRLMCWHEGIPCKKIIQTWTRTAITNDAELADIAAKSTGLVSSKTILRNHPWVEDAEAEQKELEGQEERNMERFAPYQWLGGNGDSDENGTGNIGGGADGKK